MRALNKLSPRKVATISEPGRHSDGGNLYLVVGPGASKRWAFIYRWRGKQREMGLGSVLRVSLAHARRKAAECRALLGDHVDPITHFGRARDVPLFGTFADEIIADLAPQWRNPKTPDQWRSTLQNDAAALLGLPVDAIETDDVLKVLKPIWQEKHETARRLRGRIERILDAAAARGFRSEANPARWKGHLKELLPSKSKIEGAHFASLDYRDLPDFMTRLAQRKGMSAIALAFLIHTASRSGEVRGANWGEIDFNEAIWTIPAERMKAGRIHRVPLTPAALTILKSVQIEEEPLPGALVFPGAKGRPLSDMSLSAVLRRMRIPKSSATVHGFRSSFRDWAGDESHYPREVAEAALAHIVGDQTERAYRRQDALEKRRGLMGEWSAFLMKETGDGEEKERVGSG